MNGETNPMNDETNPACSVCGRWKPDITALCASCGQTFCFNHLLDAQGRRDPAMGLEPVCPDCLKRTAREFIDALRPMARRGKTAT